MGRKLSRRELLIAPAGALAAGGCGRRKATAFRGFCFVANHDGRSIAVVDLTRFRLRKEIRLDATPAAVLAHPAQPKIFALAPENGTVYEIDGVSQTVSRRARAGNTAAAMQLAPANDALWVLYRDPAALVELPLATLAPRRRIRLSAEPDSFDLSSRGQAAIASLATRTITFARLSQSRVEGAVDAGSEPSLLRYQSDGRQLIAGSRPERSLGIFETAQGKVVVRLPLPLAPRHFQFNSDGGQLFVTGDGMDAVVIVYPYRTEVAETVLAGRAPDGMAVTDPSYLIVTNPQTNSVTVLDYDNLGKKLVAVVQVGEEPRHVIVTPDKQYALVLNEKSGDLAVIRTYLLANQDASRRYRPTPLFTMIPVGARPVGAAVVALS